MRIAFLSRLVMPFHAEGGLQRYALELASHLVARGHEVEVFMEPAARPGAATDAARRAVPFAVHEVRHATVPGLGARPGTIVLDRITNYFLFARAAARAVAVRHAAAPFDVVFAQGLAGLGVARDRASALPLVVVNHGMEEFKAPRLKRWLYAPFRHGIRVTARAAAAVLVDDARAATEARALLGFAPRRLEVVPVGLDLERLEEAARVGRARWPELARRLGLEPGERPMVAVGRLEANKGFHVALDALSRIAPRLPTGARLVLVGEGSQRDALERRARRADLGGRVRFAGRLDDPDLHALYAHASLFVHPTLYEGSSIVTLEAMAHGLPIVATRVGGIPAKLEEGPSGRLVDAGDPVALGAAVLDLLSDRAEACRLGDRARARVRRTYGWQRVAADVERVLGEARQGG